MHMHLIMHTYYVVLRVFVSTHQVSIHTIVLEYYAYYAYEYAYSSSSRTMMQRYYAYYYEQYG